MKTIPRLAFGFLCGAVCAGFFWSLGCPAKPGEQLGMAYLATVAAIGAGFYFGPVKNLDC